MYGGQPGQFKHKKKAVFYSSSPRLNVSFEKTFLRCHNVMQFRMLNRLTNVHIIVLHVLHRIITRSVTIIRKTIEKMYNLSCRAIRRVHKIRSDGNRFAIKTML